jgi:hypothetical protein
MNMALVVGQIEKLTGNVTTLNWIGARAPGDIERSLGYGPGRLREGYAIALLVEPLSAPDFEFDGTTLRSGGRAGKPYSTEKADKLRPRVHDSVLRERGQKGYEDLQKTALKNVKLTGDERIAKIVPMTRHDPKLGPDLQYPMGAGGLQWAILKPGKRFLIAAFVDESAHAHTAQFSVFIGFGAPYDNRARLMRFLREAKAPIA